MTYNFKRHLELLKDFRVFEKLNKWYSKEKEAESRELLRYNAKVSLYLQWERRFAYLSMMKDYIDGLTSAEEFTDRFVGLRQIELNECAAFLKKLESEEVEASQIKKIEQFDDQGASNFRQLLTFVYLECDKHREIYEYQDGDYDYGGDFTEEMEGFYESMKKCYSHAHFLIHFFGEG